MTDPQNVVILIWDAVRARNTSSHGYDRETTPFLSSLTDTDAVWYRQAKAPSSWTLPSHASIVTGLYPGEHQVHSKSLRFDLNDRHLATQLGDNGYRTGLFTENTYLRADEFGFSDSFQTLFGDSLCSVRNETIVDPEIHAKIHGHGEHISFIKASLRSSSPVKSLANGAIHKLKQSHPIINRFKTDEQSQDSWNSDDGAATYAESFLDWVDSGDGPFFALFNFLEAHAPYQPPPNYREYVKNENFRELPQTPPWEYYAGRHPPGYLDDLRDLYDGCIQYLDDVTRQLVERLEERGLLEETILIIAGDHGEGFGESGICRDRCIGHAGGVEEEVTHVPLVIRFPDGKHGGKSVSRVVSLKDIYGTVMATCGMAEKQRADLYPNTPFPEGVLTQRNGITQAALDAAHQYGLDTTDLNQHLVAYYENADDSSILKYVFSTQQSCEVSESLTSEDKRTILADERTDGLKRRGREHFESLEPIVEVNEGQIDISEETKTQLKNLGYR